jgi:iron complex transport system ATP-binding protein
VISFEHVRIRYPRGVSPAVDDVTFTAAAGAITAVAGPNGSGKSTLVRALLGRSALEHGTIAINGTTIGLLDRREVARRVAVVPQREDTAFPRTVLDFIAMGRFAHSSVWGAAGADDAAACDDAARRTEVTDLLDRMTDELSGGEWQRVRLARALAQETPALVLDEPNSFLDIAHEMALFELLDGVARAGVAVLLISHQLNLVARFASRLIVLSQGRVVADGTPEDVMRGDLLERVYGWPVLVTRDPAVGAPMLVPMRKRGPA